MYNLDVSEAGEAAIVVRAFSVPAQAQRRNFTLFKPARGYLDELGASYIITGFSTQQEVNFKEIVYFCN